MAKIGLLDSLTELYAEGTARLSEIEEKIDHLLKTGQKILGSCIKDVEELKSRLIAVEQQLGMRGQPA